MGACRVDGEDTKQQVARIGRGVARATACGWAAQLPSMYEILKPMATVLPVPLLAQLASNMAPKWTNSATQVTA